jgi:hypothetical protein
VRSIKCSVPILIVITLVITCIGQNKKKNTGRYTLANDHVSQSEVPRLDGFGFVVTLDDEARATVTLQTSEASPNVSAVELGRIYDSLSQRVGSRNKVSDPIIIVKPSPILSVRQILDYVKPLRRFRDNKIKIAVRDNDFLIVPAKVQYRLNVKPNPLTLIVAISENGDVTLNNERYGSINNLDDLSSVLRTIFQRRAANGVFREGSTDIETSVSINPHDRLSIDNLARVCSAIRRAGSDRMYLAMAYEAGTVTERWRILK